MLQKYQQLTTLMSQPDFKTRIQNPQDIFSVELVNLLKSLVKKLTTKHFSGGGKEDEFAKILNMHRWFGSVFVYDLCHY